YLTGKGVLHSKSQAFYCFKKAAEGGSALGAFNLGVMYELGDYIEKDLKKAFYWYRMAADLNYAYAAFRLGEFYSTGSGVEEIDYVLANYWYEIAAKKGIILADIRLADNHLSGRGVYRSPRDAFEHYEVAAKGHAPYAQYILSVFYLRGI